MIQTIELPGHDMPILYTQFGTGHVSVTAVTFDNKEGVSLASLDKPAVVGEDLPQDTPETLRSIMTFTTPESIDVLIDALNFAKNKMLCNTTLEQE